MPYIGQEAATTYSTKLAVQQFNGDGSTTAFTLNQSVSADQDILVSVDGVIQDTSAYTVSNGTTLTFSPAPSSGTANIFVNYLGLAVGTVTHPATQGLTATTGTFTSDISTPTLGTSNFRAGVNAGNSIQSGGNLNTVVGDEAGTAITTGDNNTALGYEAGAALTTGSGNTAIGQNAGDALTTGNDNVAVGQTALSADTLGSNSVAVGGAALQKQNFTSGTNTYNVAVGRSAGKEVTTGTENTLIGGLAGDALTTGSHNTYVGFHSGSVATTAANNTALGAYSLDANTTGYSNVAVGKSALGANTEGFSNTALGLNSLDANTTGDHNTAVGMASLTANTTAGDNTAVGHSALEANTEGHSNTAVGKGAGKAITTGDENVIIGMNAGINLTTGNYNILIGHGPTTSQVDSEKQIIMGRDVVGAGGDHLTFGDGSTDSAIQFGATSISAPSDVRLKEDIQNETVGLGFVNDLRPVTFRWKKEKDIPSNMKTYVEDSDTRVMNGKYNHGFIAQEVKEVIDSHSDIKDGFDMWTEDPTDGRQRVAESALVPILVKAIQELSEKVATLEAK